MKLLTWSNACLVMSSALLMSIPAEQWSRSDSALYWLGVAILVQLQSGEVAGG